MRSPSELTAETLPSLDLQTALAALPPPWPDAGLRPLIRERLKRSQVCVVVIDDDPTGTQTVHDVPVLTTWDEAELESELQSGAPVVYLISNSRALPQGEAVALAREIGANLRRAAAAAGRDLEVISRSDSTLRGHFPAETDALAEALGLRPDAVVIAPYFREGGRYTLDGVHYVQQGQLLVPAAQTEFALDSAFGYRHSDLRCWAEEKSDGRWKADAVVTLPLPTIRLGGPQGVLPLVLEASDGQPLIVNAADDRDLEVVVAALAQARDRGKRFLYRTAASFAKVRGGITDRSLLGPHDFALPTNAGGGLVVVGSYVARSSRQLARLLAQPGWVPVEVEVAALVDSARRGAALATAAEALSAALTNGRDAVLYTSREHLAGGSPGESLAIGGAVSDALVALVAGLPLRPRYLIAKGGITSSDLATRALGVRRAVVMGQIAPGVPVWRLSADSHWPDLPYVVFPGNVGDDETLAEVAEALRVARQ